ncbi:MAG: alanine--tRNA ligase [Cyclobacteriaceae bacterium]|nr:alanine--tRNA ligase [Cyclobacteriaceae bacterium HetDA_MAG_MS6]
MESKVIREKFLSFFESKGHVVVPSAPIVVQNDPTLMFTNAGMNQFKDFFLGNKIAENKRVTDTQKCLRVSGKHNDLEEVGLDTYHHTMFEMLGNWSFGDYFKEEAIDWSWELLTKVYELPEDRMYATIFEGDSKEGLEADSEAKNFWKKHLPEDRIINGSKKDNFWEMGDTGPCGPCSELHIDLRPADEVAKVSGKELVNQDHPQVVEIWNLVFIQFNRSAGGTLNNLPEQHVDTGMGFERLVMAIQAKQSNYDTDVFQPVIQSIAKNANVVYGIDEKTDIAIRVISDHIRAIAFTIADGQLPSSVKAGYVVRRILRRAVRYGYTFLHFDKPFLFELVEKLADQFSGTFPELKEQEGFVTKVVKEEEVSFLRTLEKGLKRFEVIKTDQRSKEIDGKTAFDLYDTYGFPIDLTSLIARENDLTVDVRGFEREMQQQKERSKNDAKQDTGDWTVIQSVENDSVFLGYDQLESSAHITKYRQVTQKGKEFYQVVLDQTPFYAESGGQVGDTGLLVSGNEKIEVFDTKKENNLIIHFVKKLPSDTNIECLARVNRKKRVLTESNHSATHLLHAALKEVLGDHVQQRGSLVNDKVLRFDFSHFSKMEVEEIAQVEKRVNEKIRENIVLDERRSIPIEEAKNMGATALFGEKYGDFVRVITFDEHFSRELCGGTHVNATGEIGFLKIVSESSVAAGVRRIEAITSLEAEKYITEKVDLVDEMMDLLKQPTDPIKAIQALVKERNQLQKEVEALNKEKTKSVKADLLHQIQEVGDLKLLASQSSFPDNDSIKQLAFELKREIKGLVLLLASDVQGKPNLTVMLDDDLVKAYDINASDLVREMAKSIKGGGGGQPFYATAGGKDVDGLAEALRKGRAILEEKLSLSIS